MATDDLSPDDCRPNSVACVPWVRPSWTGNVHKSCYDWFGRIVAEYGLAEKSVIEIGSGNVNGTIRDHFKSESYVGVDLAPGAGVDRVGNSEQLDDPDATWEVCCSAEMLEHCVRPWRAVNEMARITCSGGFVLLSARGFDQRGCWEPHGFPVDAYRYSELSMRTLAEDAGLTVLECTADPEGPGWFLLATKA